MAITATDIPTILSQCDEIIKSAMILKQFAGEVKVLAEANFSYLTPGAGEAIVLTNQQKLNILATYNAYKTDIQGKAAALP